MTPRNRRSVSRPQSQAVSSCIRASTIADAVTIGRRRCSCRKQSSPSPNSQSPSSSVAEGIIVAGRSVGAAHDLEFIQMPSPSVSSRQLLSQSYLGSAEHPQVVDGGRSSKLQMPHASSSRSSVSHKNRRQSWRPHRSCTHPNRYAAISNSPMASMLVSASSQAPIAVRSHRSQDASSMVSNCRRLLAPASESQAVVHLCSLIQRGSIKVVKEISVIPSVSVPLRDTCR